MWGQDALGSFSCLRAMDHEEAMRVSGTSRKREDNGMMLKKWGEAEAASDGTRTV